MQLNQRYLILSVQINYCDLFKEAHIDVASLGQIYQAKPRIIVKKDEYRLSMAEIQNKN
jgi:hypothetical protein